MKDQLVPSLCLFPDFEASPFEKNEKMKKTIRFPGKKTIPKKWTTTRCNQKEPNKGFFRLKRARGIGRVAIKK
jgi:hypothetical protein